MSDIGARIEESLRYDRNVGYNVSDSQARSLLLYTVKAITRNPI